MWEQQNGTPCWQSRSIIILKQCTHIWMTPNQLCKGISCIRLMFHFLLPKHLKKTKRQCGPWCMLGWLLNGGAPLTTEACMERLIKRLKDLPEDGYVIPYSLAFWLQQHGTEVWKPLWRQIRRKKQKQKTGGAQGESSFPSTTTRSLWIKEDVENVYINMYIYYSFKYSIFFVNCSERDFLYNTTWPHLLQPLPSST